MTQTLTVALTLFLCAPLGKRLGFVGFWECCLGGLSVSGLLAGAAVNFCAAVAPYLIWACLAANIALLVSDCIGLYPLEWRDFSKRIVAPRSVMTLGAAAILIWLNHPLEPLLQIEGDRYVVFNNHDAYFSGLSIETLNADYCSRLRIADNFRSEWSRYHFFQSSCTATLMALLPRPSLQAFKEAILILAAAGYLSIASAAARLSKNLGAPHQLLIVFVLTAMLLTAFFQSYSWSVRTTAFFSFVACFHLIAAALRGWNRESLLWLVVFASSSSRTTLTVAAAVALFAAIVAAIRPGNFRYYSAVCREFASSIRIDPLLVSYLAAAFLYFIGTFLSGSLSPETGGRYRGLGDWILDNPTIIIRDAGNYYLRGVGIPRFVQPPGGRIVASTCFLGSLAVGLFLAGIGFLRMCNSWRSWRREQRGLRIHRVHLSILVFALVVLFPVNQILQDPDWRTVHELVALSPGFVALLAIWSIPFREKRQTARFGSIFAFCLVVSVLVFCSSTIVPAGQKGPLAAALIGTIALPLLAVALADSATGSERWMAAIGGAMLMISLFPSGLGRITMHDLLDTSTVYLPKESVDKAHRIDKGQAIAVEEVSANPQVADYVALSGGFRLWGHPSFLTNRFLAVGAKTEIAPWTKDVEWMRLQKLIESTFQEGRQLTWIGKP